MCLAVMIASTRAMVAGPILAASRFILAGVHSAQRRCALRHVFGVRVCRLRHANEHGSRHGCPCAESRGWCRRFALPAAVPGTASDAANGGASQIFAAVDRLTPIINVICPSLTPRRTSISELLVSSASALSRRASDPLAWPQRPTRPRFDRRERAVQAVPQGWPASIGIGCRLPS